ncbi:MAG: DNA-protecting protein DprA, partial [Prevotella pectinovora]
SPLSTAHNKVILCFIFPFVYGYEITIIDALAKNNDQQMNVLTVSTGLPINRLTALLFELEMKGMVKALAGGMYHLIS